MVKNIKKQSSGSKIIEVVINHIENHVKQYIFVILLFFIGIIIGILLINNASEDIKGEISNYINTFEDNLKGDGKIDNNKLLLSSIINNTKTTILMWFMGSTVIGIPIVLGTIVFKGIGIGYTISSLIGVMGPQNGIIIAFLAIFLHNLIYIPAIFALGVSGLDLYKVITKNMHRENVKIQIARHTIFSIIIFIIILFSSLIESYASATLTEWYINIV